MNIIAIHILIISLIFFNYSNLSKEKILEKNYFKKLKAIANPKAIILFKNARFTVLKPELVTKNNK